jgi:hypothetical protein
MKQHKTKLSKLLADRQLNQRQFAELVYDHTGYLVHLQNLSNLVTGLKTIKTIAVAQAFATTLGVTIEDIID